jgi:hypothetical protein
LQVVARQPGLEAVALSVSCDAARCEIALQGQEVSPIHVGRYSDLNRRVTEEPWQDFRILSGDPTIAARQQAACAAAWRRLTENATPDDVVRSYLEEAERRLVLAAPC